MITIKIRADRNTDKLDVHVEGLPSRTERLSHLTALGYTARLDYHGYAIKNLKEKPKEKIIEIMGKKYVVNAEDFE